MRYKNYFFMILFIGLSSCKYGKIMSTTDPETETAVDTLAGPAELTTRGAELGEFEVQMEQDKADVDLTEFEIKELDIAYTVSPKPGKRLDIIYPPTGKAPYKPVVFLTGVNDDPDLVAGLIRKGYAVILVNYALPVKDNNLASLHDAKAAIRFLRANEKRYDLEAEKIVVAGASEGAYTAQLLAATNNRGEFEDLSMGNPGSSSTVQGVISWNGVSDLTELPKAVESQRFQDSVFNDEKNSREHQVLNPVELVQEDFPPLLLLHDPRHQRIPFSQSVEMQQKVNNITGKRKAQLFSLEKNALEDVEQEDTKELEKVLDFLNEVFLEN